LAASAYEDFCLTGGWRYINTHIHSFIHPSDRHCSYAEMHKIFIAQKSYCECLVLSIDTIRSKYYFNFILIRTRSGRELFDHPSYNQCTLY